MNTQAVKTHENKRQLVSNEVSQNHESAASTFQFVDNRPETIAQRKLQEMANNSPQVKQAARFQSMADNHSVQQQAIQKKENKMPTIGNGTNLSRSEVLQRAVSNSGTFPPGQAASALINQLDALLPAAELAAVTAVTVAGGVDTPTVAAYKNNPSPMLWGSCVEEQLNLTAPGAWIQQYPLGAGSRPDYYRVLPGPIRLFVDLTTPLQAGGAGNHITGKLNNVFDPLVDANWEAADITYNTAAPHIGGALAALVPNGVLNPLHVAKVQEYNNANRDNAMDYLDWANTLYEQFYPRRIAVADFTQVWTANERADFYNLALDVEANPQNYEDDSDMDISEE